jgi:hypothetical protein
MRWLFAFALLGGCYQSSSAIPCTLTCDQATPCPGELVCGSDGVCMAVGSIACTLIDAGAADGDDGADAPVDARMFPRDCPAAYDISIPSTMTTSRYKLITSKMTYWQHEAACAGDLPGATHLATTQTASERNELAGVVDSMLAGSGAYVHIGAVQKPDAIVPTGGWIWLDGQPVDSGLWVTNTPYDAGDGEQNHDFQVAMLDTMMGLLDSSGLGDIEGACECDGVPIDATARTYIDTDPNNPN